MSADNWTYCPACIKRVVDEEDAKEAAVVATYGKVPPEEFAEALHAAKQRTGAQETLREDYGIGVDSDGVFYVSYACRCTDCDFKFEFNHESSVHDGQEAT